MQTLESIENILTEVTFLDWFFKTGTIGEGFYLQVQFSAENIKTGVEEIQSGRKWYLSQHMTKSEIVQTAFKSVLTALEHEARENFTFKGQRIFQPHLDVDFLADFIQHNPKCEDMRNIPATKVRPMITEENATEIAQRLYDEIPLLKAAGFYLNEVRDAIYNGVKTHQYDNMTVDQCAKNICTGLFFKIGYDDEMLKLIRDHVSVFFTWKDEPNPETIRTF